MVEFAHRNPVNQGHSAFARLGYGVASQIASTNPRSTQELLRQVYLEEAPPATSVEDAVREVARLLGDSIIVTRFIRWSTELPPDLDPAVARTQKCA
jgi:hypothetical protein